MGCVKKLPQTWDLEEDAVRERRQSEASNSARHQEQEACVARCLARSQPQEQAQTRLAVCAVTCQSMLRPSRPNLCQRFEGLRLCQKL